MTTDYKVTVFFVKWHKVEKQLARHLTNINCTSKFIAVL